MNLPLPSAGGGTTPNKLKILKLKEEKMSKEKRKLTTAIINKKYRGTSVYHQAAKPVTTGFHPNKRCAIDQAGTSL